MTTLTLIDKATHSKATLDASLPIVLDKSSVVLTDIPRETIKGFQKDGNQLIIVLRDGRKIVIENFFQEEINNDVVFEDVNQDLWSVNSENLQTAGFGKYKYISSLDELLVQPNYLDSIINTSKTPLMSLGGGALAVGAGALLINILDKDKNKDDNVKLSLPKVDSNNLEGLTGKGIPGATIVITNQDGGVFTTTVDKDGNWKISPNPMADGKEGSIQQVNEEGVSNIISTGVADVTPPKAPTVSRNDGLEISGTTDEANAIVFIKNADGKIFSTTADAKGNWRFEQKYFADDDKNKENPLYIFDIKDKGEVYVYDTAGNKSAITSTARVTPINISLTMDKYNTNNIFGVDARDGKDTFTLTGTLKVSGDFTNARVVVKIGDTSFNAVVSGNKDEAGDKTWSVALPAGHDIFKKEGDLSVTASGYVTSPAGSNVSSTASSSIKVDYSVQTTPDAMRYEVEIDAINSDDTIGATSQQKGITLKGSIDDTDNNTKGEVVSNITVEITYDNSKTIKFTLANKDITYNQSTGEWSLKIASGNEALKDGKHTVKLTVEITDSANAKTTFIDNYEYTADSSLKTKSFSEDLNLDNLFFNDNHEQAYTNYNTFNDNNQDDLLSHLQTLI